MLWKEQFKKDNQPTLLDIHNYLHSPLWTMLQTYVADLCHPSIGIEYSGCSLKAGWNIKFKKKGKNLCVIYPEENAFTILITLQVKHQPLLKYKMETYCAYVQDVYEATPYFNGSKWLMILVDSKSIVEDVCSLLQMKYQHM